MTAYYNEIDPHAAEWLRNLIDAGLLPAGEVDQRSIKDVTANDVSGFEQCHFFAGIGGWPLALQLAEWPADRPVWSGSCPCQPYSAAGKRQGDADERNLWPDFYRLIRQCRPECVIGEQVSSAIRHGWLDGISDDLEAEGYACGAVVLPACSVGAPHLRQRLYWLADTGRTQARRNRPGGSAKEDRQEKGDRQRENQSLRHSEDSRLGDTHGSGQGAVSGVCDGEGADAARSTYRLGHAGEPGLPLPEQPELPAAERHNEGRAVEQPGGAWAESVAIPCSDGKARRISLEPGDEPLAYGLPRGVDADLARLCRLAGMAGDVKQLRSSLKRAKRCRVGQLKGYGNAIVPQAAVAFLRAYLN